MRTDLKLNYDHLDDTGSRMDAYRKELSRMEDALKALERTLKSQQSEAFKGLEEKIRTAKESISSRKETLKKLKKILDDYTDDMEHLVGAESRKKSVRADQYDIWYNMKQIDSPVKAVEKKASGQVWTSGSGGGGPLETDEERARRVAEERNYTRLKNCHSSHLKPLASKARGYMQELWDIYDRYIKPFEQTDDDYRKRLNAIYKEETKKKDKWKNFLKDFGKVSRSFLKSFAVAFVATALFVVGLVQAPWAIAGLILVFAVGTVVMVNVPEESVPDWLKGVKETADGVKESALRVLEHGPVVLVEMIGQGLMDQVQTPEGIASVAGTVSGIVAGGFAGSKINAKINANKAAVKEVKGTKTEFDVKSTQNQLDDIRNQMPNSNLKNRGNMAKAEVNIEGLPDEFLAHSKIHNLASKGSDVANFSYTPENKIFDSYVVDGFPRFNDTEAKILENIASQIKNPNISGTINLYTELPACQSCSNIILEFRRKFPNIKLNIFTK